MKYKYLIISTLISLLLICTFVSGFVINGIKAEYEFNEYGFAPLLINNGKDNETRFYDAVCY